MDEKKRVYAVYAARNGGYRVAESHDKMVDDRPATDKEIEAHLRHKARMRQAATLVIGGIILVVILMGAIILLGILNPAGVMG